MKFRSFFSTHYTPNPKEIRDAMLKLLVLPRDTTEFVDTAYGMFSWNLYYKYKDGFDWGNLTSAPSSPNAVSLEEFDSVYKPEILKLLAACEEELKDD